MGSTVEYLIDRIVSILSDEASLLIGVRDELDDIKRELESMRSFLEDADSKASNSHSHSQVEKSWISEVRDLAYDVEDIIDEFVYKINRKQGRHKVIRSVSKVVSLPKDIWVRHQLATKLQSLKTMFKEVRDRNMRYSTGTTSDHNVNFSSQEVTQYYGESSIFVEDDELVGIEDERQLLVGWLTDGEPHRTTISVVGMGGSGKTTLIAKAFNNHTITTHFDCCAWITVSQNYSITDLFRSMIKQFFPSTKEAVPLDLSSMTYKQLVEKLMDYLNQRRYLVVLDDVWDMNLWNEIKVSLPNNDQGSRVMLTTRREDIASISCGIGSRIHRIKPLEEHEAWELFCKKAFSRYANRCPLELEAFAKDIVQSCGGLPLAIVAMGCVMSSRELESEWKIISNSLKWELSNNQMLQMVKSILLLSYQDMPYRLKRCFLYCSLFPEDYLIKRKRLIRLWIAEGLVEQVGGSSQEEIADSYLVELIRRCMLQATERNSSGRLKSCKMHDLLRELALLIAKDERFCAVYDELEESDERLARRLSVITISERQNLPCEGTSRLRSFFVFYAGNLATPSMDTLLSGLKLLRVLDLEDLRIQKLPDMVMNLFNLRYLNLKRTLVVELPKTIGRLHNLQTLNLEETQIKVLPRGITELCKLEFLITSRLSHSCFYDFDFILGTQVPSSICHLNNLQILGCIEATGDIARELKNMKKLIRLDISNVRESHVDDLCRSIEKMHLLRRLFVMTNNEEEILKMDILDPPPLLRRLTLVGKLEEVPSWFGSLQCLRTLYLNGSRLTKYQDPLCQLQALPHLRWLILSNAYEGKTLYFKEGFHKLEVLELHCLPQLEFIYIGDRSVMSNIKELHIGKCMQLTTLPGGIEYLTKLQELILVNVSEELVSSICEERRRNHRKVKHILKITHFNMSPFGWSQESLS